MPFISAVFSSTRLCIPCGASSVEAVRSMQNAQSRNIGRTACMSISLVETPEATRSVTGNDSNRNNPP